MNECWLDDKRQALFSYFFPLLQRFEQFVHCSFFLSLRSYLAVGFSCSPFPTTLVSGFFELKLAGLRIGWMVSGTGTKKSRHFGH